MPFAIEGSPVVYSPEQLSEADSFERAVGVPDLSSADDDDDSSGDSPPQQAPSKQQQLKRPSSRASSKKDDATYDHGHNGPSPHGNNKKTSAQNGKSAASRVTSKRAEQNRAAQKAFRERKMQYVKTLEEQLATASQQLVAAEHLKQQNSELLRMIEDLRRENQKLKTSDSNDVEVPSSPGYDMVKLKEEAQPNPVLGNLVGRYVSADGQLNFGEGLLKLEHDLDESLDDVDYDSLLNDSGLTDGDVKMVPSPPALVPGISYVVSTPSSEITDPFMAIRLPHDTYFGAPVIDLEQDEPDLHHKRTREEAKIYSNPTMALPPKIFTKNEQAQRDKVESELCELLKSQARCNDVDPENCNKSKFMKKATVA